MLGQKVLHTKVTCGSFELVQPTEKGTMVNPNEVYSEIPQTSQQYFTEVFKGPSSRIPLSRKAH